MKRDDARSLVRELRAGRLTRRQVVTRMAELGACLAGIWAILDRATALPARAAPARRGGSGTVKLLYWQAPTIVNAHLSNGTKDFHASRVCMEPLLSADATGRFTPSSPPRSQPRKTAGYRRTAGRSPIS